jgi:hypothetical protein
MSSPHAITFYVPLTGERQASWTIDTSTNLPESSPPLSAARASRGSSPGLRLPVLARLRNLSGVEARRRKLRDKKTCQQENKDAVCHCPTNQGGTNCRIHCVEGHGHDDHPFDCVCFNNDPANPRPLPNCAQCPSDPEQQDDCQPFLTCTVPARATSTARTSQAVSASSRLGLPAAPVACHRRHAVAAATTRTPVPICRAVSATGCRGMSLEIAENQRRVVGSATIIATAWR